MSQIDDLIEKMGAREHWPAIFWRGAEQPYNRLLQNVEDWISRLGDLGIRQGSTCAVLGEYSPQGCGLFLALMKIGAIQVPFNPSAAAQMEESLQMCGAEWLFTFDNQDLWGVEHLAPVEPNPLMVEFQSRRHPGLVVFTSGSSGKPKGILHDCEMVLRKFALERPGYRTLLFLLVDHFGGFNTLMSVFSYGGTAVIASSRNPEDVCRTVQEARVELLPITPTFLNLLLASGCYKDFDLSSVSLITYGTEVMPETTLERVAQAFPSARLQQTYGLSELGVLRSRSKDSDSVWVKVGGQGFETKVVDGMLHVRSESAMVGYLNAPSPFDAEGWMNTGDYVETDGEYYRIWGRESDIINVGGQKVFPTEVETVLMAADNVVEATVYGNANALMGMSVAAYVSLGQEEDSAQLKARLRKFCLDRLAPYKVPVRFSVISQKEHHNERVKKVRRPNPNLESV